MPQLHRPPQHKCSAPSHPPPPLRRNCFADTDALNETALRGIADALVSSGLAALGYNSVNLD